MRVLCIVWRVRAWAVPVAEAVGSSGLRAWALGRGGSSFSIGLLRSRVTHTNPARPRRERPGAHRADRTH